ncbi:MAG TPA: hypothetical protein VFB96_25700 [Pirellulaceae bacterium]|nr:hypothetical protein [Pirellulaceae bacterium]
MAFHQSDREDLLREATALVERAELTVPGEPAPVVIGFRKDGLASFYFGADPVYQFNAAGELRRAYISGLLYKAEKGRLVELRRERTQGQTQLVRRELADQEQAALLVAAAARLNRLARALAASSATVTGQAPDNADVAQRMSRWLQQAQGPISVAASPHAR